MFRTIYLNSPKLRLGTIIFDHPKLRLGTVILDRQKLWLRTMIFDHQKLQFWTVILEHPVETSLQGKLQAQTLSDATPPIGKIHLFSKMAVTLEPLIGF